MAHDPHHHHPAHHIVPGFGADRAVHYDAQASVALAGAPALYELGVSALTAQLDDQDAASMLFVGVGTGSELVPYTRFDVPGWRFTGIDPSDAMLDVARKRLETEGLLSRTHLHHGELHTLPAGPPFDGAQMMGVLHHVEGEAARLELLREVARRLKPGAPLVVGCRIGMDPELLNVELRRWRAYGTPREELERRRERFMALKPIESDAALFAMLAQAGFVTPKPLFISLQFKVFLARFQPGTQG
ncbi:SAM-dependent methyltransferase [Myxococcus hansupus]|uniref:SAM-dependent methyltransferase n=1 Tax=Pseudomyxococcus hansupus TaxID=1297742 RepID=A0A0H4X4D7_9BACT|nr:class I SAM-dependent methyltransferase [Myxococcus hansupus]AKQ70541.1 SAM-dependent methyltransferase [Myxococcus hansupus]